MDTLTRGDFHRFFLGKYLELLRAALDPAQRRPDYGDEAVIADVLAGFDGLRRVAPNAAPRGIPRRIFMLWQQGWDEAPPLVRACAASWEARNPAWELVRLDARSLGTYAPRFAATGVGRASRQAQSDMARLCLLAGHGGVWADASLFCSWSLDAWLPAVPDDAALMLTWPRPYRNIESWLVAAPAHSPLIAAWQDLSERYWSLFRRPHHYYWLHYLFEMLVGRDSAVRSAWQAVPEISAKGPLVVAGNAFDRAAPAAVFDLIARERVPVHKLSHKWRFEGSLAATPLGALTGLERL